MPFKARQSPSGAAGNMALRGTNLTVNSDLTLSPISRPRRFWDWDYFLSGGVATNLIGRMRWSLLGNGTPTATRNGANFSSSTKISINTSATSGDRGCVTLGETEARLVSRPSQCLITQTIWRYFTGTAARRAFFGWSDDFAVDPLSANNALGFGYDSTVTSVPFVFARTGGVTRYFESAVALAPPGVNGGYLTQFVQNAAGNMDVYTNRSVLPILIGTIPAQFMQFDGNHGYRIETLTNAASRMDLAYWDMNSAQLGGVYASDNVLET